MQVARLSVKNLKGIKSGTFDFDGHVLFMGANNVGKSTLCEALDLTLGADRLARTPAVDEYDFYNARYLDEHGDPVELTVEVLLVDLTPTIERECVARLEWWDPAKREILDVGEADAVDGAGNQPCLRLLTVARYDEENDEFEAHTHYAKDYDRENERDSEVPRRVRREFNFLYLRTLRTGSRALSLERGSLLDVIIRTQGLQTGIWESVRTRLGELDPPVADGLPTLKPILESIEKRLGEYIPVASDGSASLFVSQLTREHLRKTLSFFLRVSTDQVPVPFQEVGTGTLNTLVLALLRFVADLKEEGVIFAMEEPEIALPPHTQRRIAKYLLTGTSQCFVTSHSPYVIEGFEPSRLKILRRDDDGTVAATQVELGEGIKSKTYHRHFRRALAEAMLARGVVVAEGATEESALHAAAELIEAERTDVQPLDLAGVTIVSADGDGNAAELGRFFVSLGVPVFAFLDQKKRKQTEREALEGAGFTILRETDYAGAESLLAEEVPLDHQWSFLEVLRDEGRVASIPSSRPEDGALKALTRECLKAGKGAGWAGELVGRCKLSQVPQSLTDFLEEIYAHFPKPAPVSLLTEAVDPAVAEVLAVAEGDADLPAAAPSEGETESDDTGVE